MYESKQSSDTTSLLKTTQRFLSSTSSEDTNISDNEQHSQLNITQSKTYYRSRIHSAHTGINPLITAASTLLSLTTYLQTSTLNFAKLPNVIQYLIHEVHVFETQAKAKGYDQQIIQASRHILCTTLDEILLTNVWQHKQSSSNKRQLLTYFKDEENNEEYFFSILSHARQNSQRYLHLLELIYICLSLGFEGKYRNMSRGKQQLDDIIDSLYKEISQQQREPVMLFPETKSAFSLSNDRKSSTKKTLLSFNFMAMLTSSFLMTLYAGFSYMLGIRITPIINLLSTIINTH